MAVDISKEKAMEFESKITEGVRVLAINACEYEGLERTISDVRTGKNKEFGNEGYFEIIVDFEEPKYSSVKETHPHLNGTSIEQVACNEFELAFKLEGEDELFFKMLDGRVACPNCYAPMNTVRETQYDDITWTFVDGKYVKENGLGSSDGKYCDQCNHTLDDDDEKCFGY